MAFLKFNKAELVNLSYSLRREIISANKTGAYCNTSIVTCNTRRYHGLLAVPVDALGGGNYMLLSSLDESLLLGGRQFNLGIHCFGDKYEPKGHKYIVDFNVDPVPQITYKVGEIVLVKTLLLAPDEDRLFIRYDLLDAPAPVTMNLMPFLAFRSVHSLTKENATANTAGTEVPGGVSYCLYKGFPTLSLQLDRASSRFLSTPCWYKDITYSDEYRRGFDCLEDLFVPGHFEVKLKPGESLVFSAGLSALPQRSLKSRYEKARAQMSPIDSFQDLLVRNADLLKCRRGGRSRINAGFTWLETGLLRETVISLPGLTLYADGDCDEFEEILDNLIADEQERLFHRTTQVEAPLRIADALQQYIEFAGDEKGVWKKYGPTLKGIIESYAPGRRKEVSLHPNGLLWAQMDRVALSWMNAYIDGNPVTERAGYQVDTNAWWYNAVAFAVDMEQKYGGKAGKAFVEKWARVRDVACENFEKVFWNEEYGWMADYVNEAGQHLAVRPNQMMAAYVRYSPIDDEMKSRIMAVVKNELVTKRGIRTLSPRDVNYKGVYEGSQYERDLAYHQGCTRPELLGEYEDLAFRMTGAGFCKRAEYLLEGFLEDVAKHGVGAFSELYDGDPPHEPHGAISSACATAALLRCEWLIAKNKKEVRK